MSDTTFVPSDEMALYCDVPGCTASLSMVAGVPRSEHGWGRLTLYEDRQGPGFFGARDFDLCGPHLAAITAILRPETPTHTQGES